MNEAQNLSGQTLGKYTLDQYLGDTGVAHVYRAKNPELALPLVVNVLSIQMVEDPDFYTQMMVKIGVLAEMNQANISAILDFGVEKYAYVVTPYVTGPTLRDLLNSSMRRAVRIPVDSGIFIMNSVSEALKYGHEMGIPHWDLKAENVILGEEGTVILVDYGLEQMLRQMRPTSSDARDMTMLSTANVDNTKGFKKDIMDFGKIFFEVATNRTLKPEDPDSGAMYNYIPPSRYGTDVPDAIEMVIMKALGGGRDVPGYTQFSQLYQDLRSYKGKTTTTVLPTARMSDVIAFSSRFSRIGVSEQIQSEVSSVALHFMDTGQVLDLESNRSYSLGRQSGGQAVVPDIDLSPFNAYEWGISRHHATLTITNGQVTIVDENSSNGTYHAGQKLEPNKPYVLNGGDMILLGKLRVQILVNQ